MHAESRGLRAAHGLAARALGEGAECAIGITCCIVCCVCVACACSSRPVRFCHMSSWMTSEAGLLKLYTCSLSDHVTAHPRGCPTWGRPLRRESSTGRKPCHVTYCPCSSQVTFYRPRLNWPVQALQAGLGRQVEDNGGGDSGTHAGAFHFPVAPRGSGPPCGLDRASSAPRAATNTV